MKREQKDQSSTILAHNEFLERGFEDGASDPAAANKRHVVLYSVIGAAVLAGLFVVSRVHYLLFHGLVELFSAAVALSVFLLVWNARRFIRNESLVLLGTAYLFVSLIDLVHTLVYRGMGFFPDTVGSNLAIQLWISSRGLEAVSLLLFSSLQNRRVRPWPALSFYAAVTALLLTSIFAWGNFPTCYIEGVGLTAFKKGAEYTICLTLLVAIVLLTIRPRQMDNDVYRLLIAAMAVTILAELAFTFYVSVYGLSNLVGHLLKIVSFFLIYMGIIRAGMTRPFSTLFRELEREKTTLAQKERQMGLLHDISSSFLSAEDLDASLHKIPPLLAAHFEAPIVAIELYDDKNEEMVFVGSVGIGVPEDGKRRVPAAESISGTVARTGQAVSALDVSQYEDYRAQAMGDLDFVTYTCVPMTALGRVIGTLAIADRKERPDMVAATELLETLANNLSQEINRRWRESEYRTLIENANAGFVLFDTAGTYVMLNEYVAKIMGGRPEDFIGKSLSEVLPHEADMHLERFARIIAEKKGAQFEDAFQLPTGTHWFSSDLQPVIGSAGEVTGIQIVTVDITERKLAEGALFESEEKYRELFSRNRDGYVINRGSGEIVDPNPAFANMLGYSVDEVKKVSFWDFTPKKWIEWERDVQGVKLLERGYTDLYQKEYIRKDGSVFPVELQAFLLNEPIDLNDALIAAFVRDITERKQVENERENTIYMLEVLNAKTDFRELMKSLLSFMSVLSGCEAVGIRLRDGDDFSYYETNGFSDDFVEAETHLCVKDLDGQLARDEIGDPVLECMCGNIVCGRFDASKPFFTDFGSFMSNCTTKLLASTTEADRQARTRNRCNAEGYESVFLVPLRAGSETFGLMQYNDRREGCFSPEFVDQAQRLAGNVAIALAQRQAEESLMDEQQRLAGILRGTNSGTWEWNVQTGETVFNERWAEIIGYTLEELSPVSIETWKKNAHPDDLKVSNELLDKNFSGELDYYECEARMKHKDGSWVWVLDRGRVVSWTNDGKPLMMMGTHQDISSRMQAEDQDRFLGAITANMSDSIVVTDTSFKITYMNKAGQELFGYSIDELRGKTPDLLNAESNGEEIQRDLYETISLGKVYFGESLNRRKDGSSFVCEYKVMPLIDENEAVYAYIGIQRDITERKQAEEEKQQLRDQLTQSQKMESVGRLAGGVAHDFNNMLNVIMGQAEITLDAMATGDPRRKSINEIVKAAERAAEMTKQLLAFSRKQVVEPKVVDLNDLIENLYKMLVRMISEDIVLKIVAKQGLGHIRIDHSQVEQILLNLAINARDAMPHGGEMIIETTNVTLDEDYCARYANVTSGPYVLLAVSDTGTGMDAETQAKIFEPFFTTKELDKGTGLGLATVYGIVEQNDGHIEVSSELGKGSTFKLYFPHVLEVANSIVQPEPSVVVGGTETLLVVEDEELLRELATDVLSRIGYEVLAVGNGDDALVLAEEYEGPIQLLLTDIVMPGMNGRELAEQLSSRRPSIKILYTSGYAPSIISNRGVLDEGLEFISKPYKIATLTSRIRRLLDDQ